MEKMLTVEEAWRETGALKEDGPGHWFRRCWALARQGMVPAEDLDKAKVALGELLADPLVLDLRFLKDESQWPHPAKRMTLGWLDFENNIHRYHCYVNIPRPAPAWRPKDGEWVWLVHKCGNKVAKWGTTDDMSDEGHFPGQYALGKDLNAEKDWTWEQFLARGDTWIVE